MITVEFNFKTVDELASVRYAIDTECEYCERQLSQLRCLPDEDKKTEDYKEGFEYWSNRYLVLNNLSNSLMEAYLTSENAILR